MIEILIALWNVGWLVINIENTYPIVKAHFIKKEEILEKIESLPKISVLLPAYKEERTLKTCVENLLKSDYPREKLEIIILTEEDDPKTAEIANALSRSQNVKHIVVPDDKKVPKGKPRALNEGLKHATGEIIGVIDAEDIIDPLLFKKVVSNMEKADVAQGILDMVNYWDGWLNHQFRGEYGFWYRIWLPALVKTKFPTPLGGTTIFLKMKVLQELGGWDPFNLTEDFDLGMRIYKTEYKVAIKDSQSKRAKISIFMPSYQLSIISCVTKEESPRFFKAWLKQRTRWQRGKIQTLKKLIKSPPRGLKKRFHCFMACFSPHLGAINISGIVISFLSLILFDLPLPILIICWINFGFIVLYAFEQALGFVKATQGEIVKWRKLRAAMIAFTLPAYWFLQWIADLRAIYQEYIKKKIFWEKTTHEGRHLQG